jgi:serine/threonine protein kinase
MDTQVGSLEYTAPEVLKNKPYSKMCDLWSVGVITFILLTGGFPFYDSDPHMLMKKILGLKYTYGRYESMISSEGRDFINKLLVVDPANRMTIEEAFQHPWMLSTNLPNSHNQIVVGNLKTLSASKK